MSGRIQLRLFIALFVLCGVLSFTVHRNVIPKSLTRLNAEKWDYNAWLKGWETCESETVEVLQGGSIPLDIEGTYFRNGHAKFEVGKVDKVMHPFDADGMISAVTIKDGQALFRNRFVLTKGFKKERKAKRILYRGAFGTGKRGGMFSNMFDVKLKNVANTNVIHWGGRLMALWEGGLPHRLEPDSLRTLGEYKVKGLLKRGETFSAHPRYDAATKRLVNFGSIQSPTKAGISIYEFDNDLNVVKSRKVDVPGFVFFHDFIVTKNYYIFNKAPIKFDPVPFLVGVKGPAECIEFDKTSPATIILVPRDGVSPVEEVKVDSHFNFHFSNAYEDSNGEIIFDVVWCDNMQLGANEKKEKQIWFVIDYAKDIPYSTMYRYKLKKSTSSWSYEKRQLSATQLDFPTINPSVSCQSYRYIYAACGRVPNQSSPVQGVIKIDTQTGVEYKWYGEEWEYLGECVFLPKKASTSASNDEDDGYLASFLFNGKEKTSEFVIFDAKDISKGPISRQRLPTAVPFGLHGSYSPGFTQDFNDIIRRYKACLAIDDKAWNEMEDSPDWGSNTSLNRPRCILL